MRRPSEKWRGGTAREICGRYKFSLASNHDPTPTNKMCVRTLLLSCILTVWCDRLYFGKMQSSQQWCCCADKNAAASHELTTGRRWKFNFRVVKFSTDIKDTSRAIYKSTIHQSVHPQRGKASCRAEGRPTKTLWNVIMVPMVSPFLVSWSAFLCVDVRMIHFSFPSEY
jgi:hypothetical protein